MSNHKILILAFIDDSLPDAIKEVQRVNNLVDSYMLLNPTEADIYNAVEDLGSVQGILIASHGTEDGIVLNQNETMSYETLKKYVSALNPDFLFLNSCNSINSLLSFLNKTSVDLLMPRASILDDAVGARMSSLLFTEYASEGFDMSRAIENLDASAEHFLYIQANGGREHDTEQLVILQSELEALNQTVMSPESGLRALEVVVNNVQHQLELLEMTVESLKAEVKRLSITNRRYFTMLVILSIFIILNLGFTLAILFLK